MLSHTQKGYLEESLLSTRASRGWQAPRGMLAERAFERSIEAAGPDRDAGTGRNESPGGTETHAYPGLPQMPCKPLHEDGGGCRGGRESDSPGLQNGFG